jgi:glutamate synthase domain-containing protein 1
MCGIVGLFLKDASLEPHLGAMLTDMLITMTDRGPDSAGIAIYSGAGQGRAKITVQSADPTREFANLDADLRDAIGQPVLMLIKDTHAVLEVPLAQLEAARSALTHLRPLVKVMSAGESIEIFKEVGLPKDVASRFGISKMGGTHGIGHTRMTNVWCITARFRTTTRSAVTSNALA